MSDDGMDIEHDKYSTDEGEKDELMEMRSAKCKASLFDLLVVVRKRATTDVLNKDQRNMLDQMSSTLAPDSDDVLTTEMIRFIASFVLHSIGDKRTAMLILEEATALYPKDCDTLIALALLKDDTFGLVEEAEKLYRTCLVLVPNHPDACQNLGALLINRAKVICESATEKLKTLEEASEILRAAQTSSPGYTSYNLACVASILGKTDECKRWLDDANANNTLPPADAVLEDSDLENVCSLPWFQSFLRKSASARRDTPAE